MTSKYRVVQELGVGGMGKVYKGLLIGQHGFQRPIVLKQLRDEFRFVLDETTPTPAQPKPAPATAPTEGNGATSPDKGGTGDRVKPSDGTTGSQQPVVKPDTAPAPAPKKTTTTGGAR